MLICLSGILHHQRSTHDRLAHPMMQRPQGMLAGEEGAGSKIAPLFRIASTERLRGYEWPTIADPVHQLRRHRLLAEALRGVYVPVLLVVSVIFFVLVTRVVATAGCTAGCWPSTP